MKRSELEAAILSVIPTATFDRDNDGQIVIYTDLTYVGDETAPYVPSGDDEDDETK